MSNQPPPPPPAPGGSSHPNEPQEPDRNPAPPTQGYVGQPNQPGPDSYQGGQPQQQYGAEQYQPGPQQYAGQPDNALGGLSDSEERTWSILAHLSAPVAALISAGMLNFLGPLIIWAIYKDKSQRVRHASAGAFNFNVSLWIVYAILLAVSILTLGVGLLVTIPVGIIVWIAAMIIHVMAAIKANNGIVYTYPMQIPILK